MLENIFFFLKKVKKKGIYLYIYIGGHITLKMPDFILNEGNNGCERRKRVTTF